VVGRRAEASSALNAHDAEFQFGDRLLLLSRSSFSCRTPQPTTPTLPPVYRSSALSKPSIDRSSMDTDLLLALLRSLLHPTDFSDESLLQALLDNDGNVEAAAEKLLLGGVGGPSSGGNSKKKRQGTLQDYWLEGTSSSTSSSSSSSPASLSSSIKKKLKANPPPSPTNTSSKLSSTPSSNPKKPQDLLALAALRPPPPTSSSSSSSSTSSLPPLLLPSPALLAKHLPCIVVPSSPIPSSLASALYLVLLKESETWEKVTWIINGNEVTSPHTVSSLLSPLPLRRVQQLRLIHRLPFLPVLLLRIFGL